MHPIMDIWTYNTLLNVLFREQQSAWAPSGDIKEIIMQSLRDYPPFS